MIEFDIVLDRIGHFGRYQFLSVCLVYWLGIPCGMHSLAPVFYAPPIDYRHIDQGPRKKQAHPNVESRFYLATFVRRLLFDLALTYGFVFLRCSTPPLDDKTKYPELSEDGILNLTTPFDDESGQYSTCYRYGYNLSRCDGTTSCVNKSAPVIGCDMGYHFDTSLFSSTIDTEWEMICSKQVINAAATSLFFAGMWAGAIVSGYCSDKYGRRPTLLFCNLGCLVFGVIIAFSPWFSLFAIARIILAAFSHGSFLVMCVYVMEIVGKYRSPVGINSHTMFSVGYALNSLFSYFIRDWRYFYLALSLTSVPSIVFHFFIPESPRWHFSNSRDEEGKKLSHKFAKKNGKQLSDDVWKEAVTTNNKLFDRTYSSIDLFKPPRMRLITINMMFCWFVVSLVYYGLSLNAGNLAGNIFLNNAMNGVMEICGYVIVMFTMDRWGRRVLLSGSFLLAGVSSIGSTLCLHFGDANSAIVTAGVAMAFVGKIGCGGAFSVIYNFTIELYPTVVRSNGMGTASMAARWGGIMSPFIILVRNSIPWFPGALFGALSVIAGLLVLLFPETKNKTMPQTIAEAELFYKGVSLNKERDDGGSDCKNESSDADKVPHVTTKFLDQI